MSEVIVKLTADHIKIKGGEYVQDLVRCDKCKFWLECEYPMAAGNDGFCSYGERKDQ